MPVVAVLFGPGGIGDAGRHAVKHAVATPGVTVRAISRERGMLQKPSESVTQIGLDATEPGLEVHQVDILADDTSELEKALRGVDAVISCIGNRQPFMERWMARGTRNLVSAMQRASVPRLVALTSVGIGEDCPPMRWLFVGRIFSFLLCTLLRSAYYDILAAEAAITSSTLDYVVVRPVGLTPECPAQGAWALLPAQSQDGVSATGQRCEGSIAKEDVGLYLLQEAVGQPVLHRAATTLAGLPVKAA